MRACAPDRSLCQEQVDDGPELLRPSIASPGQLWALSWPCLQGALVYVGASHLLPEVEKENRRFMISLAVGVLVALAIVAAKG